MTEAEKALEKIKKELRWHTLNQYVFALSESLNGAMLINNKMITIDSDFEVIRKNLLPENKEAISRSLISCLEKELSNIGKYIKEPDAIERFANKWLDCLKYDVVDTSLKMNLELKEEE